MARYLIRKVAYALLVIWGVVTVVFFLFKVLPGDPARMMVGQRADSATVMAIRKDLGLDFPKGIQYVKYLNDLSPVSYHSTSSSSPFYLDHEMYKPYLTIVRLTPEKVLVFKFPYLGRSFQSREEVTNVLWEALPNTFILALVSILFASLVGIIAGIFAAIYKDSWYDRSAILFSSLGMSLPSFFAAILIGWLFAFVLVDYTGLNLTGNLYEVDDFGEGVRLELRNLILPAITLGIRPLSIVIQLSRSSMLDVLSQDYIRTAFAKGLRFHQIIVRHALKNSLNPVITAVSGWFASLMAGVIFVEFIFGWKGLGYIIVNALNNYDYPLVLGSVLLISVIFVIINILVDFSYRLLDPRVKYR